MDDTVLYIYMFIGIVLYVLFCDFFIEHCNMKILICQHILIYNITSNGCVVCDCMNKPSFI